MPGNPERIYLAKLKDAMIRAWRQVVDEDASNPVARVGELLLSAHSDPLLPPLNRSPPPISGNAMSIYMAKHPHLEAAIKDATQQALDENASDPVARVGELLLSAGRVDGADRLRGRPHLPEPTPPHATARNPERSESVPRRPVPDSRDVPAPLPAPPEAVPGATPSAASSASEWTAAGWLSSQAVAQTLASSLLAGSDHGCELDAMRSLGSSANLEGELRRRLASGLDGLVGYLVPKLRDLATTAAVTVSKYRV